MMLVERRNDWQGGDMLTRPWLIAAIASALLLGEASAQGSWTTLKPIPQGANEVIGAAVDGRLYVYGGERMQTQHVYGGVNLKSQPLGIFWSYDPKADTWTQLKPNPVPVHHACPTQEGSAGILKTRLGFTTLRRKAGRLCRRCRRRVARLQLWLSATRSM
jgi:Kelch motif